MSGRESFRDRLARRAVELRNEWPVSEEESARNWGAAKALEEVVLALDATKRADPGPERARRSEQEAADGDFEPHA